MADDTHSKTILVADDRPEIRMLVRTTLQRQGRVIEASNGDQAWRLLQLEHPDLAILDIDMPGKSGIEVAREARARPDLAKTPIILLSGKMGETNESRASRPNLYMTKPFSPRELEVATVVLLRGSSLPSTSPAPLATGFQPIAAGQWSGH